VRLQARRAAARLLGPVLLAACSPSSATKDDPVCDDADKAVVADVMAKARTNFVQGDSITKDFDFIKAATAPIPEQKREYGAARLMVLLVAVNIDDDKLPAGFQGAQGPVYVVLDDDGEPIAPLGTFSQPFFDIQPPADPGWTAWADGIDTSNVAYDLFACVNPN
jgi:hypothetical protein